MKSWENKNCLGGGDLKNPNQIKTDLFLCFFPPIDLNFHSTEGRKR